MSVAPSHAHVSDVDEVRRRDVRVVAFLGISDYGFGQLEILVSRYRVAFASTKAKFAAHADGLTERLKSFCDAHSIEFLSSVNANSDEVVARARQTDLVVLGGYDAILRKPILDAPRYGVLNTHLGVLPLNRGCFPTLWAQLHGLPQGYTTYLVNTEVDFGAVLDSYENNDIGGVRDVNGDVYDVLADQAVGRFCAALERFERGCALAPCTGDREAYHRRGLPNGGWLSFHWSNSFLLRISLALDFRPYLPGRAAVLSEGGSAAVDVVAATSAEAVVPQGPRIVSLAVEGPYDMACSVATSASVGEVLESEADVIIVRTREGAVRCRVRSGQPPGKGARLSSGPPCGHEDVASAHPIDVNFAGDVLPLDKYLCRQRTLRSNS
eukprot:TRINITY_DN18169_c0_g1_i1.p1 TRINITY_DN18169_c0_g1~~TRINITY_DN18169_c0_g1_i1.p1  ORF type:complete len:382 (-),score=50.13 TRINITY_DN18169_c0_g1_i1:14-1159(-)